MGRSVAIRTDLFGVEGLRRMGRRERNRRAALRMLGIANALSGSPTPRRKTPPMTSSP